MDFKAKYTTSELIDKDTTGKEQKKTKLSSEGYAMCELMELAVKKMGESK